ncbi:MAG: hypothetical protein HUK03_06380, partial [Bacteroidaceae bacterium]|nr:hypothetical protein [Bacteroidaceae bacterium]
MKFLQVVKMSMLLSVLGQIAACSGLEDVSPTVPDIPTTQGGVLILCEGNLNAGNASLSYYDPQTKRAENGVFRRVNDRRLGDTGQSITIDDNNAYIAVENSGIVWNINAQTLRVKGQLTAGSATKIINPRHVHKVSDTKAYVTDLYAHYINIFNPQTMQYLGAISTEAAANRGFCSTEQMVQHGDMVFVNCWSYSNKILVIDTRQDAVADSIVLDSWQPKSMAMDKNGKLWVITDGGYVAAGGETFGDTPPRLYRIDAATRTIEWSHTLAQDDANVQLALNAAADTLYVLNNDVYRMHVTDNALPTTPFVMAPTDKDGRRHKLYGLAVCPSNSELYVADAVDYAQAGMVYRYSSRGDLLDNFRVGIIPSRFAFPKKKMDDIPPEGGDEESKRLKALMVTHVHTFMPAPGHQVNGSQQLGKIIPDGASMQEACDTVLARFRRQQVVSLGAQGGYVVAGWDVDVKNSQGGYDIAIQSNAFNNNSEPGIVWVMKDENRNGLPDDTWYELKGSEYGTANETLDYAITYYKPTAPCADIRWKDNQGGEGIIPYMKDWNDAPSYWQDWVPAEDSPEG